MNAVVAKFAKSLVSGLKNAVSMVAGAVASFAAASAAAAAVENHRQPAAADLRRLGMQGATFNLNF